MNRHLWLLAFCQGLFLTNNITFIAINGLVGFSLAPSGWMATLPVTGYVVGSALSTGLVAKTQHCFGRKRSFQSGLLVAFVSSLLCAYAVTNKNFWLLCVATIIAGYYSANANLYRFAAAEIANPAGKEKAVSMVMAGGLLGAVLGPNLAGWTRTLATVTFAGAYYALAGVAIIAMGALHFIEFPPLRVKKTGTEGRPLTEIMRQPVFVVAAATGALGFGVMNLLMAATPLAMQQCSLTFPQVALVLEWHVIGMFAPGVFTGQLIHRFSALTIMGVGWNFLFTGSTTLSLQTYSAEEKDKAQAALNFFVFITLAISSFASGVLVTTRGWQLLNIGSLIPVTLTATAILWLKMKYRPSLALHG